MSFGQVAEMRGRMRTGWPHRTILRHFIAESHWSSSASTPSSSSSSSSSGRRVCRDRRPYRHRHRRQHQHHLPLKEQHHHAVVIVTSDIIFAHRCRRRKSHRLHRHRLACGCRLSSSCLQFAPPLLGTLLLNSDVPCHLRSIGDPVGIQGGSSAKTWNPGSMQCLKCWF